MTMIASPAFLLALVALAVLLVATATVQAFGFLDPSRPFVVHRRSATGQPFSSPSALFAVSKPTKKKGYEPKWKKKKTLAEEVGAAGTDGNFDRVGIKGDIPVVFKQGNSTKMTMATRGQPLRDVATQAGQFIKYGCGKGECGTCEAL